MSAAVAQNPTWTPEEEGVLAELYPRAEWVQMLAALPGRSKRAIWNRAHKLGLKREKWDYPQETRERLGELARKNKPRLGKVIYPVIERDGVPGKFCSKCGEWLPLARFAKKVDTSGGVRNICTTCEGRQGYRGNREARIAAVRRYQKRYPEKHSIRKRAAERRRHGRMVEGRGVSAKELRELIELYGGLCAYCKVADADTIDHVMPLSRKGRHEIENILPACKACNFSKHTMTLEEWQAKKAND